MREVSGKIMKYHLDDWDAVIVRSDDEGTHSFRGYNHWRFMGACNERYGNVTPTDFLKKASREKEIWTLTGVMLLERIS